MLEEFVDSESLRRHCTSVALSMAHFAEKAGEDSDKWYVAGLLHDFDYERWPDEHPEKGQDILRERGVEEDVVRAILHHDNRKGYVREGAMEKTLFAVDELSGFVVAVAQVRPGFFEGMKLKSVKKKLKDSKFAAAVNREDIRLGAEELGVELDELVGGVIEALTVGSGHLNLG